MGNFFPMMVMGLFAVFWLSFGVLQLPTLQLGIPYASSADPSGLSSSEFNTVVALYLIVWGFALFTFFIFTCRINSVFAAIFLLVSVGAWVLSGAYWMVARGEYVAAERLMKVRFVSFFLPSLVLWRFLLFFRLRVCEINSTGLNLMFTNNQLINFIYREAVPCCSSWLSWGGT